MSTGETIKSLFNKTQKTSTVTDATMGLGTSPTGAENPYLAARRSWNDHVGAVMTSRQTWQVMGILCLMIALASVGGIIHIGSQSKFIPYIIEVDKLGQALAVSLVHQRCAYCDSRYRLAEKGGVSCVLYAIGKRSCYSQSQPMVQWH